MGAASFRSINTGDTAADAYDQAVAEAQYEYGHGGYTGTIAEKDGFILVPLPAGVDAEAVVSALALAQFADSDYATDQEEAAVATAFLAQHFGHAKSERARLLNAEKMQDTYLDKWGPALCFKLTQTEAAQHNILINMIPHKNVYMFAGYASE